jgi:hypothetical protein
MRRPAGGNLQSEAQALIRWIIPLDRHMIASGMQPDLQLPEQPSAVTKVKALLCTEVTRGAASALYEHRTNVRRTPLLGMTVRTSGNYKPSGPAFSEPDCDDDGFSFNALAGHLAAIPALWVHAMLRRPTQCAVSAVQVPTVQCNTPPPLK